MVKQKVPGEANVLVTREQPLKSFSPTRFHLNALAHPSLSSTSLMLALVMMASSHLNHWSLCCRMKVV